MQIPERMPRETGRDYALRTIKENIISLDLAPGSQISESELAAVLGLSRTPVREALIELSKVRIVEIQPQKRSVVAPIDYTLVEESRFMRNVLECAVVELVCAMASPEDISRLEENVRLQNYYLSSNAAEQLMELDNQFHRTLFEIAQKMQVYAMVWNLSIHFDRVRRMALNSVRDLKIVEDHAAIVVAIRDKDAAQARRVMEKHLSRYQVDAAAIREKYPQYFT
ncbi:MAG: GntR family transcriptional regulator [Ruminococcaceae bacterium]|nr:GntR family transcriptional regulator [Oscillospiraceae bacterium]